MNTKPTVVLVPGLGNNARIWSSQIEELSADYNVVVPDYSEAESINEMAESVLAQLSAESFSLVGFSLGGYIALNLINRVPNRIERLAFISSSPYADSDRAIVQRKKMMQAALTDYQLVLSEMGKVIVFAEGPNAEAARKGLAKMGEEIDAEVFCRHQSAIIDRPDCQDMLSSIDCPVRVLVGRQDVVTPLGGNQCLADNIPGASLQIVENTGHLLPLERPSEVSQFLRGWLQSDAR